MLSDKYLTALMIVIFLLLIILGCARRGTVILESEEGRIIIESKGEEPYPQPYYPSEVLKIHRVICHHRVNAESGILTFRLDINLPPVNARIYSIMFLLVPG